MKICTVTFYMKNQMVIETFYETTEEELSTISSEEFNKYTNKILKFKTDMNELINDPKYEPTSCKCNDLVIRATDITAVRVEFDKENIKRIDEYFANQEKEKEQDND